jgi:AcrR family transcriptional regulator
VGPAAPERADAARNRRRVLVAAGRLWAERGAEQVSMDAVAEAAGVGKGTLYRRFGDRAGLAVALLDARERDLQEAVLRGPPPLGPGAPAIDRLVAFAWAYLEFLDEQGDLLLVAESGPAGAWYRTPTYASWHRHVALLLTDVRPDGDPEVLAHVVLAPLRVELVRHLQRGRAGGRSGLAEAVEAVIRGALGAGPDRAAPGR